MLAPIRNDEEERWRYVVSLDDRLLKGGALLSEWVTFVTKEADLAFVKGAELASILTAMAAIEAHLRAEGGDGNDRLVTLIDRAYLDDTTKAELHELRRYRNRWVHIKDPWDDDTPLNDEAGLQKELAHHAKKAVILLRTVLYSDQCI